MTGVVLKPWGREYLCYKNAEVAIWVLEIRKDSATSLHCHPKKNTALIILRGEVELSFIRGEPRRLAGLSKINIFRGRFHRTRALTDGVVLLEVEAPDDKRDLIRLEDEHGRAGVPIEEATEPLDASCLQLLDVAGITPFAGCWLRVLGHTTQIVRFGTDNVFVTLSGGLARGLVPPGDAIDGATLVRFAARFPPLPDTTFLQIAKEPS